MPKKILIIGGCGYIGSALFEKLKIKNQVDTIDLEWFGNFNNPQNIRLDFEVLDKKFIDIYDAIILVAANSSVALCSDILDSFNNNVIKFVKLIEKIKHQKFIYASSSCVYVTSNDKPSIETDNLNPIDGLTLTKTTLDQLMPLTSVEYYGLRFGSVNGWSPNMRLDLMINSMTVSAMNNKEVYMTNGDAYRPILGINDLCRAVEKIIETDEDHRGIYNISSGNYTIKEIASRVANYCQVPLIDKGNNFTYNFSIDSDKFSKTYNFEFEENIETIVNTITTNQFNPLWKSRIIKNEL